MTSKLPPSHRALVLEARGVDFTLETRATPPAICGSAVVEILASGVISYHREVYAGTRGAQYTFPTPLVPGMSAIGRVAAVGPDAAALEPGQLVFVDVCVRARDDPHAMFMLAFHDGGKSGTQKLARDVWRDGTFAEYARVPLENCIPLDERRLCGELGYAVHDLMYMDYLLVPFGGLRDIGVQPGETVVVSPATGGYGGAAVMVAVAMGARVITMGRNEAELARLKKHVLSGAPGSQIETVKITGEEMADAETLKAFGTIDAVIDFTPPQASGSSHLRSAVYAIRKGGRLSLMGFNENPIIPWFVVSKDLSFKGKLMYKRDDMVQFVKMLERGLFPQGKNFVDSKVFRLEEWDACFDAAAEHTGIGKHVVFAPRGITDSPGQE